MVLDGLVLADAKVLNEHNIDYQKDLFTKNLDKKSLILLYFLCTFHVDLNKVGIISPVTKTVITLDEIF